MAKKKAKKKSVRSQVPARPPECNLATTKGMSALENFDAPEGPDPYDYHCDLLQFLRTLEQPPLRWGNMPILLARKHFNDDVCLFKRGRLLHIVWRRPEDLVVGMSGKIPSACTETPVAAIVECENRAKQAEDLRLILLVSGDNDDENGMVAGCEGMGFPTISFNCLANFYDGSMSKMLAMFNQGKIQVLDYTLDETRKITKSQKERLQSARKKARRKAGAFDNAAFNLAVAAIKPPQPGFTMINRDNAGRAEWHRTGTVLLTDGEMYILMGRDGDQYYGVELPDACSTVEDAVAALVPEEAIGCERQGEWFAVPVLEDEVPSRSDAVLIIEIYASGYGGSHSEIFLPIEDDDSNRHCIEDGECRVGKNGVLYVQNPTLSHDEHGDLSPGNGWYRFVRNAAVRSFSEEGVD